MKKRIILYGAVLALFVFTVATIIQNKQNNAFFFIVLLVTAVAVVAGLMLFVYKAGIKLRNEAYAKKNPKARALAFIIPIVLVLYYAAKLFLQF